MRYTSLIILLLLATMPAAAVAQPNCLEAEGEAVIVNNDLPSAKAEAINRAKWDAVEQSVGVEVNAQSVVQNMAMVDEAISKQINGSVKSYKLLSQDSHDDTVTVRIKACVEPSKAKDAVAGLALNKAISVIVLAKDPTGENSGYQESNILSQTVIDKLVERGFMVTDVTSTDALSDSVVESAIKNGNLLGLRIVMYKFLTNVMLIGKVDFTVSSKKGDDAGFGIAMPFNNVRARLTYRLVSKKPTGEMVILAAGSEQGKGLANTVEDAAAESLKDLSRKVATTIVDKAAAHLQAVSKKVVVKVNGISKLGDNFAVKEIFQNLAWVTGVEEKGLGEFTVSYPENTIYLANSISQKGNFKIVAFTPVSITVDYAK